MKSTKATRLATGMINAPLAFALELAMLVIFGYFGFHVGDALVLRILLGVGIPSVVVLVWTKWLAPKAKRRLKMPWLVLVKATLFGLAAVALYLCDKHDASMWFTGLVGLHLLLMIPSKQY